MQRTATARGRDGESGRGNDGTVRVISAGGEIDLTGGSAGGSSTGDYGAAGSPAGAIEFTSGTHVLGDGAGLPRRRGRERRHRQRRRRRDGLRERRHRDGHRHHRRHRHFRHHERHLQLDRRQLRRSRPTNVAAGATLKRAGANSAFVSQGRGVEVLGTLDLSVAQTIFNSGTVGLIHIAAGATMHRTSTSGTATVNPPVDNDGTVNTAVANGVIVLNGGTTGTSAGDYGSAAPPGTIDFATGTHFLGNGSRILGGVTISGATLQVAAGKTTTVSGANNMSAGHGRRHGHVRSHEWHLHLDRRQLRRRWHHPRRAGRDPAPRRRQLCLRLAGPPGRGSGHARPLGRADDLQLRHRRPDPHRRRRIDAADRDFWHRNGQPAGRQRRHRQHGGRERRDRAERRHHRHLDRRLRQRRPSGHDRLRDRHALPRQRLENPRRRQLQRRDHAGRGRRHDHGQRRQRHERRHHRRLRHVRSHQRHLHMDRRQLRRQRHHARRAGRDPAPRRRQLRLRLGRPPGRGSGHARPHGRAV